MEEHISGSCSVLNNNVQQSSSDDKLQVSHQKKLCEVCNKAPFKYRCPRCSVTSCCLVCVNEHKANSGCNGQRDRTAFVAIDDFTDLHLLSDYRLLEDTERRVYQACENYRLQWGRSNSIRKVKRLVSQARKRGINLRLAPLQFSERRNNMTAYRADLQQIEWQVRWVLPDEQHTVITQMVLESTVLNDALNSLISQTAASDLAAHRCLQDLTGCFNFLWKVLGQRADMPKFEELDSAKSLKENLARRLVLEHPVIHIVKDSVVRMTDSSKTSSV